MKNKLKEFEIIHAVVVLMMFSALVAPLAAFAGGLGYDTYNTEEGGLAGEYFTNFAVSARAFGMGKAYTALSDDASGPYWNPAGLVNMKYSELSLLNTKLYIGTDYNFAGFSMFASSRTFFGISWAGLAVQGIREINNSGDYMGDFSDSHNVYYLTYSHKVSKNLSMGLNIKTLYHTMMNYYSTAFGLDMGIIYNSGGVLFAGISVQNIPPFQPKLKLKSTEDVFPVNIKTGIALKLKDALILAGDLDILNCFPDKYAFANPDDEATINKAAMNLKWHTGLELLITRYFAVRAGVDTKELSVGVGFNTHKMAIDYAANFHNMGLTHRFGVKVKFNVAPSEEEKYFAEKMENIENLKKEVQKERNDLEMWRSDLAKKEKVVEEIMMSTKKVEDGRYRTFTLQDTYNKAIELFDEGNFDQAEAKAQEILKIDVKDAGATALINLIMANRYLNMNKYQKALKEILEALEVDPNNDRAKEMLKKMKDIMLLLE